MDNQEKRQVLISGGILADTRAAGKMRKPARLRGFSAPALGHRWPGAWPTPPGAILREPWPILGPPAADSSPLHGKPIPAGLGQPLGIRQVAELIGCSPWTVRQTLIPRGLPYFRFKASGRLTFYQDQVIRWIENQQQGGKKTK